MASPAVELAQRSDPGRDPDKQVNEDACGYRETRLGHLCVVCDGMGGHAGGREASNLALEAILERFDAAAEGARAADVLRDAIAEANRRVNAMATSPRATARPGSTVVAILTHADGTEVAHVGDSRCYHVHQGQIFQVTKDHSMVQQLVDAGLLTPAQAAVHPNANQITRALGMAPEVDVDVRAHPVGHVAGDAFVLCSDGLSDLVEPQEILHIVGSNPPMQAAALLVDLANARGGYDNISVMILRTKESATVPRGQLAPTVADDAGADTTVQEHPSGRITEPGGMPAAAAMIPANVPSSPAVVKPASRRHDMQAPPSASGVTRRGRSRTVVMAIGVVLGLSGVGAVVMVMVDHEAERSGKRKAVSATHATDETPPDASTEAGRN